MVTRGSGGGGCLRGRRSRWGNSVYCFKMWLCRLTKKTGGFGHWKNQMFTLFVVLTIIWHLSTQLTARWLWSLFGIRIYLWRLWFLLGACFRYRLPTKDNLFRRGAINHDSCLCVAGCGSLETVDHLFFHCSFFGSVWNNILHWIGLSMALPFVASDHFNQFGFGGGGPRVRHSFMCVIWFATVWEIWKDGNNMIFIEKECPILRLVDKIKLLSFSWSKEKFVQFSLNYHGWRLNPPTVLGYG